MVKQAQTLNPRRMSTRTLGLMGLPVVIAVLAFNFMGDGLRDAADPYSR